MSDIIYLDNGATTKPLKLALEKASVFNEKKYFNASALYNYGLDVHKELNYAKKRQD